MYIPGTTCLHILLAHPCLYYYLLSPQYTVLHILFYYTFYSLFFLLIFILFLPIFIYILLCYVSFFCTVHWADLSWFTFHYWLYPIQLSMWRIKRTLNLEPWRAGVQEPIPEEPQWPLDVLWISPLPRPPWKTDQWDRIQTSKVESAQWCPVMRGWTGADRSSRMRTDYL